ncbi:MAG TPA: lytic transglycosylase domain-containing protein [Anaerolineae bacterium]|nr:lytic transglycosylase domain-containing protein [Ardenticatenia bacterium]HQZ70273.1 lytic transglycosylase domain-containing protein [Anaerolineae bacterium]HRA19494.1 lytic transglycosylase domain-containing protein [Anaerolineae bacterium]
MTAHVSSYAPHGSGHSNYRSPASLPRSVRGGSVTSVGLLVLGLVMLGAAALPQNLAATTTDAVEAVASAPPLAPPMPFSVQALGSTERAVPLYDAPGAVVASQEIPSGASVEIGGQLRVASGLGLHALNWVRIVDSDGYRYGFVTADAIRLTAGEPALLDSADLRPERWSQPQSAASYSGGETIVATSESSVDSLALTSSSRSSSPDIAWLPQSVQRWWPDVARIAARHKVDPELVAIIILVESGGDPEARSSAGATGLMQLMPATATEVAQQLGMSAFNLSRLTDPLTNVELGTAYIAQQLGRFGQSADPDWQRSVELAAAAYNGGPGTVLAMLAGKRSLPAETAHYVDWVGGMWRDRRSDESSTFSRWWSAGGQRLVQNAERRLAAGR